LHNFVKWERYEIRQTWTRNICIKLLKLKDSLCGAKNGHKGIPFCRIVVSVHAGISTHLACRRTLFTVRRLKLIAHTRTSALLKGIITAQAILFRFVLLYSTVKLSDLVIQGVQKVSYSDWIIVSHVVFIWSRWNLIERLPTLVQFRVSNFDMMTSLVMSPNSWYNIRFLRWIVYFSLSLKSNIK